MAGAGIMWLDYVRPSSRVQISFTATRCHKANSLLDLRNYYVMHMDRGEHSRFLGTSSILHFQCIQKRKRRKDGPWRGLMHNPRNAKINVEIPSPCWCFTLMESIKSSPVMSSPESLSNKLLHHSDSVGSSQEKTSPSSVHCLLKLSKVYDNLHHS